MDCNTPPPDTHTGGASSSSAGRVHPLKGKGNLKGPPTPPRARTPTRRHADDEAQSFAALAIETARLSALTADSRAMEAELRATALEDRCKVAEAHAHATAGLNASLLNAADLARQAAVGEVQTFTPGWPGSSTVTFDDPLIAPAPVADPAMVARLAALEAHMASMQQDAQENEESRLIEAAEYE